MNIKVEDTKHIQLLVACNPKEVALIMLYINKKIITSLNIPNKTAKAKIIIILVICKYRPSNPYLITANFSSSYSNNAFANDDVSNL